jgi:hypothetical protein
MTDIVEQIDALAADEKCPNCDRPWHQRPLTLAAAHMYDTGGVEYLTTATKSPIVCDGSALIGPRRPPYEPDRSPERRDLSVGYTMSDLENPIFEFVDQVSGVSYVEYFAPPPPPQGMIDACATLLGIDLQVDLKLDLGSWLLPVPPAEPTPIDCSEITALDVEFGPQHWTTGHTAAPAELTTAVMQRWQLLTTPDVPCPEPPGYDFTPYQDDLITKQYPTTKKRRNK